MNEGGKSFFRDVDGVRECFECQICDVDPI